MEARAYPGDIRALVSPELERRGFLAAFTERTGGGSEGPFSTLNLGSEVGDDPRIVEDNRRRLAASLDIQSLTIVKQVHGTAIHRVTGDGTADPVEADALVTSLRSVPVVVMTADCVPVALASEAEGMIAAVHIGWRGLAAGLVQRSMALFRRPHDVAAAIGPAIGPCHYEVGGQVVEAVTEGVGEAVVTGRIGGRASLDLGATVQSLLRRLGASAVERSVVCTACEPLRFFSHRGEGTTGRQALVAVRL